MSDSTLPNLTAATTVNPTDLLYLSQSGVDAKATVAQVTAAPNVFTTYSGALRTEFYGPFLSGQERGVLYGSNNNTNWFVIPGLGNYNPPVATGYNYAGMRNVTIVKLGAKYVIAYSPSYSVNGVSGGTDPGYADIAVANGGDLSTWTYLTRTNSGNIPNWNPANPKWFVDKITGNVYLSSFGGFLQNTSKDGVSWASSGVESTLASGPTLSSSYHGDIAFFQQGATYVALAQPTLGAPYHVLTSTTLLSGWVDLGAPSVWQTHTGMESISAWEDSSGVFHALSDNAGWSSTSTNPSVPSSWSAEVPDTVGGDGGGVMPFNDIDTLNDVVSASLAYSFFKNINSPSDPIYNLASPISMSSATEASHAAVGTLSISGWQANGTGTSFTQLHFGDALRDQHGNQLVVGNVVSDTQLNFIPSLTTGWNNGDTFTVYRNYLSTGYAAFTSSPTVTVTGGAGGSLPGGHWIFNGYKAMCWYFPYVNGTFSNTTFWVNGDSIGSLVIGSDNGGNPILTLNASAASGALVLGNGSNTMSQPLTVTGAVTATQYKTPTGTPAVANGTNVTTTVTGNNTAGTIQIVVAGSATTGVISTVTLANSLAWPTKAITSLEPANAAAANLATADAPFVTGTTSTWVLNTSGAGMPVGTYLYNYITSGY